MKNNFLGTKYLQILMGFALLGGSTLSAATLSFKYGQRIQLNHALPISSMIRNVYLSQISFALTSTSKTGTISSDDVVQLICYYNPQPYLGPTTNLTSTSLGTFTVKTNDGTHFALVSGLTQVSSIVWKITKYYASYYPTNPSASIEPISSTGIDYNFSITAPN